MDVGESSILSVGLLLENNIRWTEDTVLKEKNNSEREAWRQWWVFLPTPYPQLLPSSLFVQNAFDMGRLFTLATLWNN